MRKRHRPRGHRASLDPPAPSPRSLPRWLSTRRGRVLCCSASPGELPWRRDATPYGGTSKKRQADGAIMGATWMGEERQKRVPSSNNALPSVARCFRDNPARIFGPRGVRPSGTGVRTPFLASLARPPISLAALSLPREAKAFCSSEREDCRNISWGRPFAQRRRGK